MSDDGVPILEVMDRELAALRRELGAERADILARLEAFREATALALAAAKEAVIKAEGMTNIRLEANNHAKALNDEMRGEMMPRETAENEFKAVNRGLDELRRWRSQMLGTVIGVNGVWVVLLAVIGVLVMLRPAG